MKAQKLVQAFAAASFQTLRFESSHYAVKKSKKTDEVDEVFRIRSLGSVVRWRLEPLYDMIFFN